MAQKWNLGDIRPAGTRKAPPQRDTITPQRQDIARKPEKVEEYTDPELSTIDILDGKAERRKRMIVSCIIVLAILGAGFFVNTLMGGAEVVVNPKFKDVTVQANFTALTNPQVGDLSYELLTLEASGERQVTATGETEVKERATGKILIYNAYSVTPQRLIKNTRFATPEGLIFRINESVEVPGTTKNREGILIPGVITADVFADGTGEQYNIKPTRFTVPGLSGSEQFEKVYAESTNDFTGGFEGKKFVTDETEFKTADQSLQLELRDALLARIKTERPAGFIIFDDAVTFTYEYLPSTEYKDGMATIKEKAKLQVPIFAEGEFATYLAKNTIKGFEESPVSLPDPHTLIFSYTSPTTSLSDISKAESLEFMLKGNTRILWTFDAEKLKTDIAGKSKTALPSVITSYPSITKFEAKIKPFWKQEFPEDTKKIEITTVVAEGE